MNKTALFVTINIIYKQHYATVEQRLTNVNIYMYSLNKIIQSQNTLTSQSIFRFKYFILLLSRLCSRMVRTSDSSPGGPRGQT